MTRVKTDCFAYRPGQQKPPRRKAECTALDKLYCRDGECRFYKAADEVGYPKNEYKNTQNMSTAAALIRAQGGADTQDVGRGVFDRQNRE